MCFHKSLTAPNKCIFCTTRLRGCNPKLRLDKEAEAAFEAAEKYDETIDVHSANFDAEKAFKASDNPLYLTKSPGPSKKYDNLAKVKHLVFADHKEFCGSRPLLR